MATNKKAQLVLKNLLARQDYLVVQGNDLAKAFGGLKAFEQRILDYCFSYVQLDDEPTTVYEVSALELIKHFNLNTSGKNYNRIGAAFKTLNENTALYLPTVDDKGVRGIQMTQLFSMINFKEDGVIQFEFSRYAAPLVFDLKKNFYSFRLAELSRIKGKYGLILLKLWESYRLGDAPVTLIDGSIDDWQNWFLGTDTRYPTGVFYSNILKRAIKEIEEKLQAYCSLTSIRKGHKIISYRLEITDTTKLVS